MLFEELRALPCHETARVDGIVSPTGGAPFLRFVKAPVSRAFRGACDDSATRVDASGMQFAGIRLIPVSPESRFRGFVTRCPIDGRRTAHARVSDRGRSGRARIRLGAPRTAREGVRASEVGPTWQGRPESAARALDAPRALRTNMRELRTLLLNACALSCSIRELNGRPGVFSCFRDSRVVPRG
jgi:hypothetical protein